MDLVNQFNQRHEGLTEAEVTVQTPDGKEYLVLRCAEGHVLFFDEKGELQVKSQTSCSWLPPTVKKERDMTTHDDQGLKKYVDAGPLKVKSKPVLSPSYWGKRQVWVLDTEDLGRVIIRAPLARKMVAYWQSMGKNVSSLASLYDDNDDPNPPNPASRDTTMMDASITMDIPLPTTEKGPSIAETPTPSPPKFQANMANRTHTPAVNLGSGPSVTSTKTPLVKLYGRHIPFMAKGNSSRTPTPRTYCTYKFGEVYGIMPWSELRERSENQQIKERSPECGLHPPSDHQAIRELFESSSEKLKKEEFEVIGWGSRPKGAKSSYNTPIFRITEPTKWVKFREKREELGVREDDLDDPVICSVTDYRFAVAGTDEINRSDIKHFLGQTELGRQFLIAEGQRGYRERTKTPDQPSEVMPYIQSMKDELEKATVTLHQLMARVAALEGKIEK